jgi:hypothetical protein
MLDGVSVGVILSGRNTSLLSQLSQYTTDVSTISHVRLSRLPSNCKLDKTLHSWGYVPVIHKVSTTKTHINMIHYMCKIHKGRDKPFLILEDDALVTYVPYWHMSLRYILGNLPTSWGATNLGCSNSEYGDFTDQLKLLPWRPIHWGAYAIAYNPNVVCSPSIEFLVCGPADYAIYNAMETYVTWPPLFGHNYSIVSTVGNSRDETHKKGIRHEKNIYRFWKTLGHRIEL